MRLDCFSFQKRKHTRFDDSDSYICSFQRTCSLKHFYGGHKAVARPDPFPNSAVKHRIADGSACIACARVGSRRTFPKPDSFGSPAFLFFSIVCNAEIDFMSRETLVFIVLTIIWFRICHANLRIRLSEMPGAVRRVTADERCSAHPVPQRPLPRQKVGKGEGSAWGRRWSRIDLQGFRVLHHRLP